MMKQLKCILTLLLLVLVFSSCQENEGDTEEADALLLWSGEYASDGCGFTIQIGDTIYKPEDENAIPDKFKAALRTPISLEYIRLNKQLDRRCGLSAESRPLEAIKVVSVDKR